VSEAIAQVLSIFTTGIVREISVNECLIRHWFRGSDWDEGMGVVGVHDGGG